MKKILIVVAMENFRDEEYEEPRGVFEQAGLEVKVAGERAGDAYGKMGAKAWVDMPFSDVNLENFDAVVFVGGTGSQHYFHDEEALNLAREAMQAKKLLAAICIAPTILANAGVLQGKRVTAFESEKDNLEAKGATFTGNPVEMDDSIITAKGPEVATEFGEKIVDALNQ